MDRPLRSALVGVVGLIGGWNAAVGALSFVLRDRSSAGGVDVAAFAVVDDRLWRSAAPGADGYRALADAGAAMIVDLRAETDPEPAMRRAHDAGLTHVHLPVRDGQVPPRATIERFVQLVEGSEGPVVVHCGAGVGRTGVMVAAWRSRGGTRAAEVVVDNLRVGPPSLEQLAFAARGATRPGRAVVALSRVLDGPRRTWHWAHAGPSALSSLVRSGQARAVMSTGGARAGPSRGEAAGRVGGS